MLRQFLAEDINELVNMRISEQTELYDTPVPEGFARDVREYFLRALTNEDVLCFVALSDTGDIAATCTLTIEHQPPQLVDNGIYAYLCNAYTKPEYRRRGIQRLLTEYALAEIRRHGVCAVYFDSNMDGEIAMAKKLGFVQRTDYYSIYFE